MDKATQRALSKAPNVSERGGTLYIQFKLPGHRNYTRKSLGIDATPANVKAAADKLGAIKLDIRLGSFDWVKHFPNDKAPSDSLHELMDRRIEHQRLRIAPSTLMAQVGCFNKIRDLLADKPINQVTRHDLITLQNALLKKCSSRTVNQYLAKLKPVFVGALADGLIERNPFDLIDNLKVDKAEQREIDPFTREEGERLVAAGRDENERNIITTLLWTGIRHGELAALAWEDVDLVAGTITIGLNLDRAHQFKAPKTKAGRRTIDLLPPAVEALKAQAAITKMRAAETITIHHLYGKTSTKDVHRVFLRRGPRGSFAPFSSPQLFENRNWAAIIRRAGLRYRVPYQTRHSYASWLLSAGVDPMYVATQMGHADWGMIRTIYGKWIPQDADHHRQQVASKLGLKNGDFGTNMVHGNQS